MVSDLGLQPIPSHGLGTETKHLIVVEDNGPWLIKCWVCIGPVGAPFSVQPG